MLRSMKRKNKEVLWFLVIVIGFSFTFFGVTSVMKKGPRGSNYAGTIFGRKVSQEDFSESWAAVRNQAIMNYGHDRLRQIAQYLDFDQQAWQRLILIRDARKKGFKVKDEDVVDYIAGLPFFQTEGKFDNELYKARLELIFLNTPVNVFEKQIREFLFINKLYQLITKSAAVTEEEIKQAFQADNEKIKIEYILFPDEKYKDQAAPQPEQIQAFYDNTKANYKKPEQRDVEYICVLSETFLSEAKTRIKEEDLQNYYDDNKKRFEDPAQKEEPQYKPFDQVRKEILNTLAQQETSLLAKEKINQIYDNLIESDSLPETARKYNLSLKQTGFFSREDPIPEVGFSREFIKEAFDRKTGEYSDIIETPKGFYIIQPFKTKDPYIPELNEIAAKVKKIFIDKQASVLAKTTAEETKEKIAQAVGSSFIEAAKKLNFEVKQSDFVNRNDYIPELGPCSELKAIFETNTGDTGPVLQTRKGSLLFKVTEIQAVDETKFTEEEQNKYRQKLLGQKQQQLYSQYMRELELQADLRSNLEELRRSQ
ncbi:MAG: peptidyl-prolyl cis-trans isomerase [Candidatus Omnitrophica bacterium]|nr:peptidyl-prolyl cis-trans isomerase [Candidatus Omnitrophota bacterium]